VRRWIDVAVPLLQEVVNYGTNVWARCSPEVRTGDYNLSIFSHYLHLLQMTDGVEVLVASAAPGAARPQLRSSLEAVLSLEYILEADTEVRGRAYLVAHARSRIAMLDALAKLPATTAPQLAEINKSVADQRKLLQVPDWGLVDTVYGWVKKSKRGRRPAWHELGGGPANVRDLAIRLGREQDYDVLYRQWSSVIHADDLPGQLVAVAGGKLVFARSVIRGTSPTPWPWRSASRSGRRASC
jgi:hypothetical protein